MADDVLVEKVFNFICGSGGFAELSLLLKDSSPLRNIKSKLEAKNWLINHAGGRFVVMKDSNDEVTGIRIDLKKKICQQYIESGSCRRAQGKCKFWHICKRYIEGDCDGKCCRSHTFFDNDNEEKTKDLKIEKHPNGTLRNIVAWSLPQVCQLYLKSDCKSEKCPYLHVCSNVVRQLPCSCVLSQNLTDVHNKKILKQYDLVPHQSMKTAFVCSSILVMKEQKFFDKGKCTSDDATVETATATPVNKLTNSAAITPDNAETMTEKPTLPEKRGTKDTQSNATTEQPKETEANSQPGTSRQGTKTSGAKDFQVSSKPKKASSDIGTSTKKNETKCDSRSNKQQKQKSIPKHTKSSATPQNTSSDIKTERTETECDSQSDSRRQETQKSGTKHTQSSTKPLGDSCNFGVDINKQSKTECNTQSQTRGDHTNEKEHVVKSQEPFVNNLASSSTAPASFKKSPEFLNIQGEEDEDHSDSSLDENKSTSDSFKVSENDKKYSKYSLSALSASEPSSKVVGNDSQCIQAKTEPQKKLIADSCAAKDNMLNSKTNDTRTFTKSLSASGIKTTANAAPSGVPVLPVGDIGNDFVKRWVMGGDEHASDLKETQSLENSQIQAKPVERQRKLSISSSCSSVPDPQKCTPSKKAVFDCVLKEYNGTVAFPVISNRQDLFPEGCGDIAAWFRGRKESFLLRESKDGTILEVSAYCRRARLCFNQDNCSRQECSYLHVCREYIAGSCRFGSGCQRNHSFEYDERRMFISKLKLNGLSEEGLRKIVQLSIPQVCIDYNEGHCAWGESCGKIHICRDMIRKKCEDEVICGLKHEGGLLTAHSTSILHNYGLKIRDGNVHPVLRALLVCEKKLAVGSTPSVKRTVSTVIATSSTASEGATHGNRRPSNQGASISFTRATDSKPYTTGAVSTTTTLAMPVAATDRKVSIQDSSVPLKGAAVTSSEPSERKVFECLCKEFNCSVSFSVIAKRTDLFPTAFKDIDSWFRQRKGSFLITENHKGVVTQVNAFAAKARLCFNYNNAHYGTCNKENCSFLHVCKDYITESCTNGATCPRNHQFHNEKDKDLLSKINLDQFTDEQLRRLVLSSTPLICVEYNDGICDRGDDCSRIHMCSNYLKKCYREGRGCGLDHESALTTGHTKAVLERYRMDHLKPDVAKRIILLYDDLAKDKEAGHVLYDKPDAPICSEFLLGKCRKGKKCSAHHCSLPYHWQYGVGEDDVWKIWKSFSEEDNEKLEKLYCDVMLEECSATGFQLSLESDGLLLFDEEYNVNFLLDNKLMIVQKDFEVIAEMRRLSTESFAANVGNPVATVWKWYWKDENGVWLEYDIDYLGKDLQRPIEDAFLSGTNCFKFKISEQDYTLYFFPTTDMYQENLRYGTTRKVRRRPEEFKSAADIRELRRSDKVSSGRRKPGKNVKSATGPTNWTPIPPNKKYTRVVVSAGTSEYRDVEKLFKRTIQKSVVIRSIERVQNQFEWDKYQSKKENMLSIKTSGHRPTSLNEKRLFHGTSPEAVEAICKQNFDWRLHGKNATVYGEGSYFALNASYSDAYAKEDANSSKFIFLAKVLVGSYTKGDSSYRRPPLKNPSNPASDLYDSCVDDKSNPTIFVVFDTNQFYPEYIIEYSHESAWYSIAHNAAHGAGFQQAVTRAPVPKPRRSQAPGAAQLGGSSLRTNSATPHITSSNLASGYYLSSTGASSSYSPASNTSSSTPYRSTTSSYSGTSSARNTTNSSYTSSTATSSGYSSSVPYHNKTSSSYSGTSYGYSSGTNTSSGTQYRGTSGLSADQSRGYSSASSYSSSSNTSPSKTTYRSQGTTHGSYPGYTTPSADPKRSSKKDSKCLVM